MCYPAFKTYSNERRSSRRHGLRAGGWRLRKAQCSELLGMDANPSYFVRLTSGQLVPIDLVTSIYPPQIPHGVPSLAEQATPLLKNLHLALCLILLLGLIEYSAVGRRGVAFP